MRYGKGIVLIFTVLLLAVALYFGREEARWDETVTLSAQIPAGAETIRSWQKNEEVCYLFLPSYAELSQTELQTNIERLVQIDGQEVTDGMRCDGFRLDVPYDLAYAVGDGWKHFQLYFVQSGNLPAMYVDVPSGSMDFIHKKKGNQEPGILRLYGADGALQYQGELEFIKGRGNSSWLADKKPYSLRLREEADLLDMGTAGNWVLLTNAYDSSNLKNKLISEFSQKAGMEFTPQCQWVDLYLNGEYAGLYLLSEKNEIHPQRVNIGRSNSFLVSKEWEQWLIEKKVPYIATESQAALRIWESHLDTQTMTRMWQSAENAILSEDGRDPITEKHWTELIDLDSWAKKYLVEEVFCNIDAGVGSQFFYFRGSGKIFAGPIWDYDDAMNFSAHSIANRPYAWIGENTPWFYTLYQDAQFRNRVRELYETAFLPLLTELVEGKVDQYRMQIEQASRTNQIRWEANDPGEGIEDVREFLIRRMAFLNRLWVDEEPFYFVMVNWGEGSHSECIAVSPGERLPDYGFSYEDTEDMSFLGWYNLETDEPFDVTQPIYGDVHIYPKWEPLA